MTETSASAAASPASTSGRGRRCLAGAERPPQGCSRAQTRSRSRRAGGSGAAPSTLGWHPRPCAGHAAAAARPAPRASQGPGPCKPSPHRVGSSGCPSRCPELPRCQPPAQHRHCRAGSNPVAVELQHSADPAARPPKVRARPPWPGRSAAGPWPGPRAQQPATAPAPARAVPVRAPVGTAAAARAPAPSARASRRAGDARSCGGLTLPRSGPGCPGPCPTRGVPRHTQRCEGVRSRAGPGPEAARRPCARPLPRP
mmetsp:Transcript_121286/g.387570  ORF Transcript_121286/g.387570 Transcript_121286/m.387570 type:complete len:256 (-) Transcript_121286:1380-2147(-)